VTTRRDVLAGLALAPALTLPAAAATTDLALTCDTALGPALIAVAARFAAATGVRVRIFPTGPGLILPQLQRQIQNDLLVTQRSLMDQAVAQGLIAGAPAGAWRTRLIIVGAPQGLLAVSDPLPGSDMDGPAIAKAMGRTDIVGVHDTTEVMFLLRRGQAAQGLLHEMDVPNIPGVPVLTAVPELIAPPFTYTAAVTTLARRPNPRAFLTFLIGAESRAILSEQGLEWTA
jgi:molybdate transport system substrate-binding protein